MNTTFATDASKEKPDKMTQFNQKEWSLSDFQIAQKLGRGKFGHVYAAIEKKSGQVVALKVIHKRQIGNYDMWRQLQRELQIQSHLVHVNCLRLQGVFLDDDKMQMLTEQCPHGCLFDFMRRQPSRKLTEKQTAHVMRQVIVAFDQIHSKDILHRDLKPENIMVWDDDITIKIADFGWGVLLGPKERKTKCGTTDYMSPELFEYTPQSYTLDYWTIGVLAFELSSGCPPFSSRDRQKTKENIKTVTQHHPGYFSFELRSFIDAFLKKEPTDRITMKAALNHNFITKYCGFETVNKQ